MTDAVLRLAAIREAIARAAAVANRQANDVTLVAVSKNQPEEAIEPLIQAGVTDFGESRVQEALSKWPILQAKHGVIRLHCIGRLQSNKAAEAVQLFDFIHSVDRLSLLDSLSKEAQRQQRFPSIYLQVNIGDEEQKGGCAIDDIGPLLAAAQASPLPIAGLMAIPPLDVEPSPYFALLAKLARRHDVEGLSMGMSSDFGAAVMLGATAVRVGSALFKE